MYIDLSAARARRSARPEPVAGVRLPTPSYGRFLQADPIGYGDGLNLYGYVGGDPVNGADPGGLCATKVVLTGSRIPACMPQDGMSTGLASGYSPHPMTSVGSFYTTGGKMNVRGSDGRVTRVTISPGETPQQAAARAVAEGAVRVEGFRIQLAGWWSAGRVHPLSMALEVLVSHSPARAPAPIPSMQMTPAIEKTLRRIFAGQIHPHRNDSTIFYNRQQRLPSLTGVTYYEYVHPTPGVDHAGQQRIVIGTNNSVYYSPDHFHTFFAVRPKP